MQSMHNLPKDELGVPTQPYVGFAGGGGGGSGWTLSIWVYPLPPDGPLEIFVALPSPATQEFEHGSRWVCSTGRRSASQGYLDVDEHS